MNNHLKRVLLLLIQLRPGQYYVTDDRVRLVCDSGRFGSVLLLQDRTCCDRGQV